jgi:hypothetical protein
MRDEEQARQLGIVLADLGINELIECLHWRDRMGGLLIRPPLLVNQGLWLKPCCAIHTIGMRYPIAAVFLTKDCKVLRVVRRLEQGRVAYCLRANSVIECLPLLSDSWRFKN